MINTIRGETALTAGGKSYRLLLTLGALAEIESGLGLSDLSEVSAAQSVARRRSRHRGGGAHARRRPRHLARRCHAPLHRSRPARESGGRSLRSRGPFARSGGGRARSVRPFRWQAWLEFGLGVMRLPPCEFWRMSLAEWRACVRGYQARRGVRAAAPLARSEFEALMERYPDG